MNMRKIIAVLSAVLMLCAIVPMGVFAAPGDVIIEKNFDDGSYFSNGSNENGYMVFDATTANWANVYIYANSIKSGTKYEISFDCKANKASNINVKINNNWAGDTFKWTTNVTTEWVTYTCVINPDELATLTSTALLMFTSNTTKANGAVYHIDNVVVTEYTDPDTIGKITNGSFEDGTNGWSPNSAASLVTDAQDGSQALQMSNPSAWASVATQTIPVEANASYEITWYSKRISGTGAFNLIACQAVSPWGNYTKVAGQNWMNETSGNWVANSYTVNVGDNTSMLLKFTTEASNPGEILIDNVVVSKLKDPSFDGYITNGDFETGKVSPWTVYSGTAVSADAAKDGDYGLYIKNPTGGWGGTAYQNFTTEAGKTYVVMMDAKALSNGQNIQIKDNGTVKASKWFTATSWTTLSFEYTAETTAGNINICGGGTGGNEEIYVDNVFVFEKKAASNDGYIVNGDFETGTVEGLSPYQSTCVSRDAAKDGNFGLKMMGNGGWGGVGLWTITGLEAGATYKFEMDMNAIEQGFNWTLWQDSTSSGVKYANGYFSTKAWTHIEKEFVANSTTAVLNINGGGNGNAETVYLDNLKITELEGAEIVTVSATDLLLGETASIYGSSLDKIVWTMSVEGVVELDQQNNTIKAIGAGTTVLTATFPSGKVEEFTFTVEDTIVSDIDRSEYSDVSATANTDAIGQETAPNGDPNAAVDGNSSSFWHSNWSGGVSPSNPAVITVDLGTTLTIGGFKFQQRPSANNGIVQVYGYRILDAEGNVLAEGTNIEVPGASRTGGAWTVQKLAENADARYIEISVLEGQGGFAAIAEIAPIRVTKIVLCDHENTVVYDVKNPTCLEDGYTGDTYCDDCGELIAKGEPIPALGHTPAEAVIENEKAATCTEAGSYDSVVYCSECDMELNRETVTVPALGHTEEILPAVEPTCTETGLTEGKKCSVCGEILVAQEEIPALGHDWHGTGCSRCDATRENPFTDVPEDSFYIDPVLWAVEKGITNGATETTFNPNGNCMRAHVVTFLWRAAGSPEPTSTNNPFVDVKETDFYYKAVLWAVENEITNGLDATHFGPTVDCNRAQVVTFLWRAMNKPAPTEANHPFTDVVEGQFYYDAMLWAVENGITNGLTETTFGPNALCNRAQVVTFLYRTYVK